MAFNSRLMSESWSCVPQHAIAQPVECADPHAARVDGEHRGDACEHLLGGLVGEGHGEQAVRTRLSRLDQPRDTRGEHARLAAAGARQDQRGLVRKRDRFKLGFVETGKKIGGHRAQAEFQPRL
jgi:hypothetical protein